MKIGKLDNEKLESLILSKIRCRRPEVIETGAVGEDCAVIDFGRYNCVLSTDPITGAVNEIGRLAVNICCNDIASNGVEPLGILLTVMVPPDTTEEQLERIMRDASDEASKLNVEIVGGHTEITPAVNVPIISAAAVGRQIAESAVYRKAEPGDWFIMTKQAGIEGSGIIASDHPELLEGALTDAEIAEAAGYLKETSVVREGVIAGKVGVGPMHDVTEGGILGAVWEICRVSGVGADIDTESIPVRDLTKKICGCLGLNPYRLISSGCMLMVVTDEKKDTLLEELDGAGIPAAVIGRAVGRGKGAEIEPPGPDELFKIFD